MPFSDACIAKGVQPIIGAMLGGCAAARDRRRRRGIDWLALYAQDEQGYANLCKLVSAAHLDRPVEQEPHVPFAALEGLTDGLIALTAGAEGALARLLADGQRDKAEAYLDRLQALFPDRLYIEICRGAAMPVEEAAEAALIDLAYARDLPLVATNPAAYADPSFHAAHDAMLCIANSAYVESADRVTSSPDAWLKDRRGDGRAVRRSARGDRQHRRHRPALRRRRAASASRSCRASASDEDEQLRRDARAGLAGAARRSRSRGRARSLSSTGSISSSTSSPAWASPATS